MRILYVLRSVQHPLIVRGALRHYHFLRRLAEQHSVTLLALTYGEVPDEVRAELDAITEKTVLFPADGSAAGARTPRALRRLRKWQAIRAMRATFQRMAADESYDMVLFHGKALYPVIAGFTDLPLVVDFCDATSLRQRDRLRHAPLHAVPRRWAAWAAARRTERQLLAQTRHQAFISRRDRDAVLAPDRPAVIIPNGIDLDYWRRTGLERRASRLVFTGVMDYAPNADASLYLIREIMPRLRRERPDVELFLVGMNPPAELVEAAAGDPAVTVTGFVDDLRPYMEEASVYVAPLRYASGLQNKILEALALEVPVVTTRIVAEGLRIQDDVSAPLRVAGDADDFAECVLTLLNDRAEQHRLAAEGRRFVEAHFNWDRAADMLDALCRYAAGQSTSTTLSPRSSQTWQPV